MKTPGKVLRILLDIWGAVSLIGAIALAGIVGAAWLPRGADQTKAEDLRFVLNWGEIGGCKIVKVVHSYESGRLSLDGDHCNAYCMRIDEFPEAAVEKDPFGHETWLVGPVSDPLLKEAIWTASEFPRSDNLTWFPSAEDVNSDRFYLSLPLITAYNQRVEAVRMITYDRKDKLLYYSDVSW